MQEVASSILASPQHFATFWQNSFPKKYDAVCGNRTHALTTLTARPRLLRYSVSSEVISFVCSHKIVSLGFASQKKRFYRDLNPDYKDQKVGCYYSTRNCMKLGWCCWLSRVPHTHEVTSSILVPSIFFDKRKRATGRI